MYIGREMDEYAQCEVTVTLTRQEQVECPECKAINSCEPDMWARTVPEQTCTCGECGVASLHDRWKVIRA